MATSMSTQEMREALEERQKLISELLEEEYEDSPSLNRRDVKRMAKEHLDLERQLHKDIKKRTSFFAKQEAMVQEFINHLLDDSGKMTREKLFSSLDVIEQNIFNHAIMLVTAKRGNVDFIRNLSREHREAIGIIEVKSIEDRLSNEIEEEAVQIEHMLQDSNKIIVQLKAEADRKQEELEGIRLELEANQRTLKASEEKAATANLKWEAVDQANKAAIETSKQQLQKSENQVSNLTDELQAIRQNRDESLKSADERLAEAQEKFRKSQEKSRRQAESLSFDLNTLLSEREAEEKALQVRVHDLEEAQAFERFEYEAVIDDLEQGRDHIQQNLDNLGRRYQDLELLYNRQTRELQEAKSEIGRLRREAGNKDDSIRQLQNTTFELRSENLGKSGNIAALEKQLKDRDGEIRDLNRIFEKARAIIGRYLAAEARPLTYIPSAWQALADSFIRANYMELSPNADAAAASRFWKVAQPWPAAVPIANFNPPPEPTIMNSLVMLYGRLSTGDLDGYAYCLLELLAGCLVSAERKRLQDRPFRTLLATALRTTPPTRSLRATVFCFGLLQLGHFSQIKWQLSLPELQQLRDMLQQSSCYEMLRDLTWGRNGMEALDMCRREGIAQGDIGLVNLRPDGILMVHLRDLTLRIVHPSRAGFLDESHGRLRSPSGNDIVLEISSQGDLMWWLSVGQTL